MGLDRAISKSHKIRASCLPWAMIRRRRRKISEMEQCGRQARLGHANGPSWGSLFSLEPHISLTLRVQNVQCGLEDHRRNLGERYVVDHDVILTTLSCTTLFARRLVNEFCHSTRRFCDRLQLGRSCSTTHSLLLQPRNISPTGRTNIRARRLSA